MLIQVPKSGSTSIMNIMVQLAESQGRDLEKLKDMKKLRKKGVNNEKLRIDRINVLSDSGVMRLINQNLTSKQLREKLDTYFTFIVVRHPLSRLVSGFLAKMNNKSGSIKKYAEHIITKYRDKQSEVVDKSGVHFHEFVQYVSEPDDQLLSRSDDHWRTVTNLCHPCHIGYDYIGKMETIDEDVNNILSVINTPTKSIQLRKANSQTSFHSSYSDIYSNVTKASLTKLLEKYSEDMDMFGYTSEDFFAG